MKNWMTHRTQEQHAESARRRAANKMEGFNALLASGHGPTAEELVKLRAKNPALWGGYPDPKK